MRERLNEQSCLQLQPATAEVSAAKEFIGISNYRMGTNCTGQYVNADELNRGGIGSCKIPSKRTQIMVAGQIILQYKRAFSTRRF